MESICRQQNKYCWKIETCYMKCGNGHSSPFPIMFSKVFKTHFNIHTRLHKKCFQYTLTLSQTTNFRLFQIGRADDNFEFYEDDGKFSQRVENTVGKRRNCLLQAIFPFPSVFKTLVLQTRKNQGLFGKGLTLSPYIYSF